MEEKREKTMDFQEKLEENCIWGQGWMIGVETENRPDPTLSGLFPLLPVILSTILLACVRGFDFYSPAPISYSCQSFLLLSIFPTPVSLYYFRQPLPLLPLSPTPAPISYSCPYLLLLPLSPTPAPISYSCQSFLLLSSSPTHAIHRLYVFVLSHDTTQKTDSCPPHCRPGRTNT